MEDELALRRVGHRIKVAAVDAEMTQEQLAEILGVSVQTVGRHMRGQNPMTIVQFLEYAQALGVEPCTLLPRLDSNQQPTGQGIAA